MPSFDVTATYTSHTELILVPIESWDQGLSIGTKNINVRCVFVPPKRGVVSILLPIIKLCFRKE